MSIILFDLLNKFLSLLIDLINFMGLPFGVELSEKWFIELWNYSIIPHLNEMVKMKQIDKHLFSIKQTDPTEWVLGNYAWPKNDNNVNIHQRLLRVKLHCSMTTNRISSSSDDSEFHTNSSSDNKNQNLV